MGIADPAVAAVIEQADQAAVQAALTFIEKHALFTRTGPQGIRQVNVGGLIATASPAATAGPGNRICTPMWRANKVQTLDSWLSIDGRVLFKANVAASESYNTALEQHLHDTLGLRFTERPGTDPAKRPIREIVGVDPRLKTLVHPPRPHQRPPQRAGDPVPGSSSRPPTLVEH